MVRSKLAAAILGAGLVLPGLASALGVGEYTLKSYLNQPLALEISLHQTKDLTVEEVVAALASAEEFERAGVERVFFLQDLRFEVVQQPGGGMAVLVRTSKPVNEPFLNFLVDVQWPQGRMLREYTILLDPPVFKAGDAPTATAEPVVVVQPEEPVAAAASSAEPPALEPVYAEDSELPPPPTGTVARQGETFTAPAEEPAPSRPAPVAQQEGEYKVQANDTLGRIAEQYRGGATAQQTMIAIQRANPEAFIHGNVNLVKKGAVLRIPGEAEIQQISTSEANSAFASQTRAWREMLDQRAAALPSDSAALEAGKTAASARPAPKASGKGEVTLVAPTASGKAGKASGGKETEALQNQLAIAEEGLDKAARENKELASRLGDLDKQVKASDKLLAMKNDQISGLQDELNRLRKEKGLPEVAAPAADAAAETAATDAAAATAAAAEEKPVAAKPKPEKKKPAPVVEDVPPPPPPGLPLLPIAGGLAVLAAAGAGFWFWRRKQAASPASVQAYAEEGHDAQVADDLAQLQDLNIGSDADAGDDDITRMAGDGGDGGGDPLGEADMYMAYGRFQQAADILYAALQREPERDDIRVKLAEVYAEMGDTEAAREQASAVADSGNGDVRRQAESVLARLGGGAAAGGAATAAAEESLPSLDDLALEFSGGKNEPAADDMSFDLGELEPAPAQKTAKVAAVAPVEEELEFSLDDVDMGEMELGGTTEVRSKQALDDALSLEETNLDDFTFDEAKPAAAAEEFSLEDELTLEDSADALSLGEADDSFDFAASTGAQAKLSDEMIEEVAAAPAAPAAAELDLESELADLQSDLKDEGVAASADGGDDFDFLADSDENATKLDLAKAYIDMGDAEGARDILNEVVAEGTAGQQAEARKLLTQVG